VGGFENDRRGTALIRRLFPASYAQAPTVSGFETWKIVFRGGRDEVVAMRRGEREELGGHLRTHHVYPMIAGTGPAVAIPIEPGPWCPATNLQLSPEDVGRHGAAA